MLFSMSGTFNKSQLSEFFYVSSGGKRCSRLSSYAGFTIHCSLFQIQGWIFKYPHFWDRLYLIDEKLKFDKMKSCIG